MVIQSGKKASINGTCAVILGGYVNGYSIIQELSSFGIEDIILLHYGNQLASYSNKITDSAIIDKTEVSLYKALVEIRVKYEYLILFPTDDLQIENLFGMREKISSFCFLPFNTENILEVSNKAIQYSFCEKLGVPFPKTIEVSLIEDLNKIVEIPFPIIVKPNKREDLKIKVFRSIRLENDQEYSKIKGRLIELLEKGVSFVASEIIPGDTNGNIYAYTAYRSSKSNTIINEWIGKKLTQYPDDYGVFSSASNQAPKIIEEQGRTLLNGMNLHGICEPEFKFDHRDGKYKLMEINLRSMMWHRLGHLSGVYLQYTQWCDALGIPIEKYNQKKEVIHFSYLKHEIVNLIFRNRYFNYFKANLIKNKRNVALYDRKDIKPFVFDSFLILKEIVKTAIKKIIRR